MTKKKIKDDEQKERTKHSVKQASGNVISTSTARSRGTRSSTAKTAAGLTSETQASRCKRNIRQGNRNTTTAKPMTTNKASSIEKPQLESMIPAPFGTQATRSNKLDKKLASTTTTTPKIEQKTRGLAFPSNHFQTTSTAKSENGSMTKTTLIPGESLLKPISSFPSTAQSRVTTLLHTNAQDSLVSMPTQAKREATLPTTSGTQGNRIPRIDMAAGAAWGQKNPNSLQLTSGPYREITIPRGRAALTVDSAVNGVAGSITQAGATALEGWASISSEDGFIQQAEIDLSHALMEQEAYLESGYSIDDPVLNEVNRRVEYCRDNLDYYVSGKHKKEYENYRKGIYNKADKYYADASELETEAKEGLTSLGKAMVDGGIVTVQSLFDTGAGMLTGIPSVGYAMLRSFGDGAHEAYKSGWGVDKQIGDGLKSAVMTYLSHKTIDKDGVVDVASKSLAKKVAREIGGSKEIIEALSAIPLRAAGVTLYTKIATFADRVYEFATKGNADDTSIKQYFSDLEENLVSSALDYAPNIKSEIKKWVEWIQ